MYRDPTEFRKRFAKWKQGKSITDIYNRKIPKYNIGNDAYKYLYDNYSGQWNRITNDHNADVFSDFVATPHGNRNSFSMYENTPNPAIPKDKNENIIPDNTLWTRQQVEKANNTRTWRSDAADVAHAIGEGALLSTAFMSPEIEPLVYPTYQAAKQLLTSSPTMQYLRYPIGKIMYGMDAQFPTLYRKLKSPKLSFEDGMVQISNPESRFAYEATGEESPIITNFTYDAPVRTHSSGDWDSGLTLAIPGRKALLGKNVVSTEPSDLFTFGDNIRMNPKDVTLISGDADELQVAAQQGIKTKTSPKLQSAFPKDEDFSNSISLTKTDYSEYAKEMELFAREVFGSPTKKDVDFMNYVLQPKIKGQVYNPNMLDYLIREGVEPFGDRIGNARLREYFLDPDRWANLLYDPATHAEANFRKANGIVLKKRIPLNKRKVK